GPPTTAPPGSPSPGSCWSGRPCIPVRLSSHREEPIMSTSASKPVHPEFVVAMRGYDRLQVDEYVARLIEWMDDAQTRAEQAEADELLDQARAEREALVASAQRTSQRLARRSERRQQEIEEVVASLEQRRRALVDEMARLRAALGAAIDSSADHTSVLAAGEIEGPAVDEAPAAGLPPGRPEATAAG